MRIRALLILLFVSPLAAQAPSLYWPRYDLTARLDADGVLHVVETLHYVFDGEWNGGERVFRLSPFQEIDLVTIGRVEPGGRVIPLTEDGDLENVDDFAWTDSRTLRWRSKLRTADVFRNTPITYRIEYALAGALEREGDDRYLLDFALFPPDRAGRIEIFTWRVDLDSAWETEPGAVLSGELTDLEPGYTRTLTLPLVYREAGTPAGIPEPANPVAVGAITLALLLFTGWSVRSFVGDERRKGRFDPVPPPSSITPEWIREKIFGYRPEVIGAAWDEKTASAEVAAMLARMVQEGKLGSHIRDEKWSGPDLQLMLLVPRGTLSPLERTLVNGFFFDGDQTSTSAIREHYRNTGFDPASQIASEIAASVDAMVKVDKEPPGSHWGLSLGLLLAGVVSLIAGAALGTSADIIAAAGGGGLLVLALIIGLISAVVFQKRVHDFVPNSVMIGIALGSMVVGVSVLAAYGASSFPLRSLTILGLALVAGSFVELVFFLARTRQSRKRRELRRDLVSARRWLENELRQQSPRFDDSWYPYLLAFGLGPHIDHWFRSFGGSNVHASTYPASFGSSSSGSSSSGGSTSSWSGGGGAFGGAGASGAWAVAAASLGAGVSAPSSSGGGGGGGGGGSSGGGGAGGW